ncbi:hypothetical protein Droror1_Dr00008848 [Drosera rotundifolia]
MNPTSSHLFVVSASHLSFSPNVSSQARHCLCQPRRRTSSPSPAPNRLSLSLSRSVPKSLRHLQLSFAYHLHSGVECESVSEALKVCGFRLPKSPYSRIVDFANDSPTNIIPIFKQSTQLHR